MMEMKFFMNATSIQWILWIPLVITAMSEEPGEAYGDLKTQYASDILTITLCGLTGPFLIFLMPLFTWKWFQKKNRYNSIIMLVISLILIVQLSVILTQTVELQSSQINLGLLIDSKVIGTKIFGGLFLGSLASFVNPFFLSAMYFTS